MAASPRYIGSKTGEVVRAISVESIHSWRDLQAYTGFSEKELNFHLSVLYNDNVLVKQGQEYHVVPELEEQYVKHFNIPPSKPSVPIVDLITKPVSSKSLSLGSNVLIIALIIALLANIYYVSTLTRLQDENYLLQSEVNDLTSSVEQLQSTLDQSENTIETLNQQINELEAENRYLESQITQQEPISDDSTDQESQEIPAGTISDTDSTVSESSSIIALTSRPSSTTATINSFATVNRVIDGDTLELSNGQRVRLADIDAPESYESGFTSSKEALTSWVLGTRVYLDIDDVYETDRYGRLVCVVYVAHESGYVNVNSKLLTEGYAKVSNYDNEFDPTDWTTIDTIYTGTASTIISSTPTSSSTSSSSSSESSSTDSSDDSISESSSSSSTSTGPYYASKNSNIYHKPSCYWAKQISSSNLITFGSKSAAEAAGYRACKVCKP